MAAGKGWRRAVRAVKVAAVAAIVVTAAGYCVGEFARVNGRSMEPALASGDAVIFEKLTLRWGGPKRFDVVVFKAPNDPDVVYIKRVVGLPDEVIEVRSGRLLVNGGQRDLPAGLAWETGDVSATAVSPAHYYVVGDNLGESVDSRHWGSVPRDYILGRVWLRFWPVGSMRAFRRASAEEAGAGYGDKNI